MAQLTSNMGTSVVSTQRSVSQLDVCTTPLKVISNADVHEEANFDTLVQLFTTKI